MRHMTTFEVGDNLGFAIILFAVLIGVAAIRWAGRK